MYHGKLKFLKTVNTNDIMVRTSTELRTAYVAGGLLQGMHPEHRFCPFPVYSQPSSVSGFFAFAQRTEPQNSQIDSIVPNYRCPAANSIRDEYQSVSAWTDHLTANQDLKNRLDATLGTAGLSSWSSWCKYHLCFPLRFLCSRPQMITSLTPSRLGPVMATLYHAM